MKWLTTILTAALTTTGYMLETTDPCDSSPVTCDTVVDTRTAKLDTPSLPATSDTEAITINFDAPRAEYHCVHYADTLPVGVQNQFESTGSSHTFKGLDPNREYHFSVIAVSARGILIPQALLHHGAVQSCYKSHCEPNYRHKQYYYLDYCQWC